MSADKKSEKSKGGIGCLLFFVLSLGVFIYFVFIHEEFDPLSYEVEYSQKNQQQFKKKLDSTLYYSYRGELETFAKKWENNQITASDTSSKEYILKHAFKKNIYDLEELQGVFIELSSLKHINQGTYKGANTINHPNVNAIMEDRSLDVFKFESPLTVSNSLLLFVEKVAYSRYFFVLDVVYSDDDILMYDYRKVMVVDRYTNQIVATIEAKYRTKSRNNSLFKMNVVTALKELK